MSRVDWLKKATVETLLAAADRRFYRAPTFPPHLKTKAERPLPLKNKADWDPGAGQVIEWSLSQCEIHTNLKVENLPITITDAETVIGTASPDLSGYYGWKTRGLSPRSEDRKYSYKPCQSFGFRLTSDTLVFDIPNDFFARFNGLTDAPVFSVHMYHRRAGTGTDVIVDRTQDKDVILVLADVSHGHAFERNPFETVMLEDFGISFDLGGVRYYNEMARTGRDAIGLWNSMKAYKDGEKPWCMYGNMYKHWAIPKSGKDGYRLISAPRGGLKAAAANIHDDLKTSPVSVSWGALGESGYEHTLSYMPGMDYVAEIARRHLDIESAGRYCLQVDLKDCFTNLQPKTLYRLLTAACRDEDLQEFFRKVAPALGFVKLNCGRAYTDKRGLYIMLFGLVTTKLPLWKRELGGYNVDKCDGSKLENGVALHDAMYRDAIIKPQNFGKIAELHRQVAPYVPVVQRGVPQGAAFSGDVANMAASVLARATVHLLQEILTEFKAKDTAVEFIVYSDNIYLLYNAPTDLRNILKRELPDKLKDMFRGAGIGNLIKPWKILNFDREKEDVKLLGLILDKDGNIRLSRRYRRKINQSIIHTYKGEKNWGQTEEGRKNWYLHVRQHTEGGYARGLIGEEPEADTPVPPKPKRGRPRKERS